jgi:hypothetical protein
MSSNDDIIAFVPDILLRNIPKCEDNQNVVTRNYLVGACMLADISGFTKLSDEYNKQGRNGLDILHSIINDFLSRMINLVYSFGGDGKSHSFINFNFNVSIQNINP